MPLRFVVLHHTGHGPAHFDLMVEVEGEDRLATWRLACWPPVAEMSVEPLAAHRRVYLEYEGTVSNGRGEVRRVTAGLAKRAGETIVLDCGWKLTGDTIEPADTCEGAGRSG